MGKINWGRVILGGLVAGLIINISETVLNAVVMMEDFEALMEQLGLSAEMTAGMMAVWMLYGFALGIASIWLYAAIRPRYGAGPTTALCAGAAVWFFSYLLPSVGMVNMGIFPAGMMVLSAVWGLVELLVATVVGASLYKEEATATATA